jgi:hypothetical protein
MLVKTDFRFHPVAAARDISYEPTSPITSHDVQGAIEQVEAQAVAAGGVNPTIVTFAMSPYSPVITDTYLLVDTTGGAVVIQLPLSAARLTPRGYIPIEVKDDLGNSAVNAISVLRSGAELIDGVASYPIDSPYTLVKFQPKASGGYDAG